MIITLAHKNSFSHDKIHQTTQHYTSALLDADHFFRTKVIQGRTVNTTGTCPWFDHGTSVHLKNKTQIRLKFVCLTKQTSPVSIYWHSTASCDRLLAPAWYGLIMEGSSLLCLAVVYISTFNRPPMVSSFLLIMFNHWHTWDICEAENRDQKNVMRILLTNNPSTLGHTRLQSNFQVQTKLEEL